MNVRLPVLLLVFLPLSAFGAETSRCYGSSDNGRLASGWQLPASGRNFSAYSAFGVHAGRNFLHSKVYQSVVEAYAILERQDPSKVFVYGESGFRGGGKFWPHKTHQNGLSVDFFVPVIDSEGKSVALPIGVFNKFGYGIEFDDMGKYRDWHIDYSSMAHHLLALKQAAARHGVKISRVIFDNGLQQQLFKVPEAAALRRDLVFSTKKPWVRHDEHYHVDFAVACEPIQSYKSQW